VLRIYHITVGEVFGIINILSEQWTELRSVSSQSAKEEVYCVMQNFVMQSHHRIGV
jgi:hypothetical protein